MFRPVALFWKRSNLTRKIVGSIVMVLTIMACVSFWITQSRVNRQAEDAFIGRLRMLTEVAEGNRIASAEGGHAWQVTQRYAKNQGYTFRTPAQSPNDPTDTPDGFEGRAFVALASRSDLLQYIEFEKVNGHPVIHYARAVEVTQACRECHSSWVETTASRPASAAGQRQVNALFSITAPLDELAANQRSNALAVFLIGLGTLLVGAFTISILVRRLIIRPLQSALVLADGIAAGDLAVDDVVVHSEDEMGRTAAALNLMKKNLGEALQGVVVSAGRLAQASASMAKTVASQSEGAERQKEQTAQVATAMHEIDSTVSQVSESSSRAAEASQHALETARQGGEIVSHTLSQMRAIASSVSDAATRVQGLGKNSDQIGEIVVVIEDIADQTNLLALNAAIEAARAGEHGRGFAVVSDEVRKLAERTSQATGQISAMISAIQGETRTTVAAMQGSTQQVEEGVASTSQAGTSLQKIIEMSQQVGDMVTQIATATTQQSAATEQVTGTMEQIAHITEETAAGALQSAQGVRELADLASDMQRLMAGFKLPATQIPSPRQVHDKALGAVAGRSH